tara:strand:- start:2484 stop:3227 length:744 start_codon:yes stop_codon:yes gene_type:complete
MSQNIVITGASQGIGKSIANYFRLKGANVIGLDIIDPDNSSDFFEFCNCDVSSSDQIKKVVNLLQSKNIEIDGIVNNAAIQVEKTLVETTEEEWDKVIAVNLKSIYLTTKFFLPLFRKSGSDLSITNISSVHVKATSTGLAAYVASKGGVSSLTKAMALELAENGIRVNSVHPGAVDTPMLRKGLSRNGNEENSLKKISDASPLNKIGSGDEIAGLVYYLTNGDGCLNITGQEFYTDSGVASRLASE